MCRMRTLGWLQTWVSEQGKCCTQFLPKQLFVCGLRSRSLCLGWLQTSCQERWIIGQGYGVNRPTIVPALTLAHVCVCD